MREKRTPSPNLIAFVTASVLAGATQAHEDALFPRAADGTLSGLPAGYSPASVALDLAPLEMCTNAVPKFSISIAGKKLSLPPCIVALFRNADEQKIRFTGSWYHERWLLPPYLNVVIPVAPLIPEISQSSEEFHLLINMDTGGLLRVEHYLTSKNSDGSWSTRGNELRPERYCTEDELSMLVPAGVSR